MCAVLIDHTISTVEDVEKWISYIISMDEGVQYRTTKTAQGTVGGCIEVGE